ncbi:MAG: hypothetical protein JO049_01380 [Hyphomicrobiales bacterium]|jgi:hypothetical protein|nr:hypothetical protein [Hyphomicrobiales bacterium]
MGRSDEYRRYAAECLEMASAIHDPKARATLLLMAQVWLRLAGRGELQDAELQDAEEADAGQGGA